MSDAPAAVRAGSISPAPPWLRCAEWVCALALTAAAVWLRVYFVLHAGGLWRDEATSAGWAAFGSLGEVWKYLYLESFPIGMPLLVRGFVGAGGGSDAALRTLALLIGLGVLGAFWFAARAFRTGVPIVALALFGFCLDLVVWPDTLRAYGLGALTAVVALGCFWRLADAPSPGRFVAASVASVLAVHSTWYGALWVLAGGLAGAAVVWQKRRGWKSALAALGAGAVAASSLLPYLPSFHRRGQWDELMKAPRYDLRIFFGWVAQALGTPGLWVWGLTLAIAMAGGGWLLRRERNAVALFGCVALAVGVAGHFFLFKALRYWTHQWNYVVLLAGAALCLVAVVAEFCRQNAPARWLRLAGCALAACAGTASCLHSLPLRMTNIDLIAGKLAEEAHGKDLIVVNRWFLGCGYLRYHSASAPWTTLPPMADHRMVRNDFLKALMEAPDQTAPVRPLLAQIESVLRGGGRVFFVGGLLFPPPGQPAPILPPAPLAPRGWDPAPYEDGWATQVGEFVKTHGARGGEGKVASPAQVGPWEDAGVLIIEGWKEE